MAEIESVEELDAQLELLGENPNLINPMIDHSEGWPSSEEWSHGVPKPVLIEVDGGVKVNITVDVDGALHVLMHDMGDPGQFVLMSLEQRDMHYQQFFAPLSQAEIDTNSSVSSSLELGDVQAAYSEYTNSIADVPPGAPVMQVSAEIVAQSGVIRVALDELAVAAPARDVPNIADMLEAEKIDPIGAVDPAPEPVVEAVVSFDPEPMPVREPETVAIESLMRAEGIVLPSEGEMASHGMLAENALYEAARFTFYAVQADGAIQVETLTRFDEVVDAFDAIDGDVHQYAGILRETYGALYDESGEYRADVDWGEVGALTTQLNQTFAERVTAVANPNAGVFDGIKTPEVVPAPVQP